MKKLLVSGLLGLGLFCSVNALAAEGDMQPMPTAIPATGGAAPEGTPAADAAATPRQKIGQIRTKLLEKVLKESGVDDATAAKVVENMKNMKGRIKAQILEILKKEVQ